MIGRSHAALAACAWYAASAALAITDPVLVAAGYPLAVAGGLLPDLDHPGSTLGRLFPWLSRPVAGAFGHRGFTHSPILTWHLYQVFSDSPLIIPLLVGMVSHILADLVTPAGVQILFPVRRPLALPLVRTDAGENCLVLAALLAVVVADVGNSTMPPGIQSMAAQAAILLGDL